jgi:Protein of unknown function (DUF3892)
MATYPVTNVRMGASDQGGRHEHIVGACVSDGRIFERRRIVDSIRAGDRWVTRVPGAPDAIIHPIATCPHVGCLANPYITTSPDGTKRNNLDDLPRC